MPCVSKHNIEFVDTFGNSNSETYDTNGCPYAYTDTGIYVGVNNNIIYINDINQFKQFMIVWSKIIQK